MELNLKDASACRYDAVSLGEVMLRLDPGDNRIRNARQFTAWKVAVSITSSVVCAAVLV